MPLSGIIFQFYNADLLEIGDSKQGEDAVGFIDDTLLLAHAGTLGESNGKVKAMMEKEGGDGLVTNTPMQLCIG